MTKTEIEEYTLWLKAIDVGLDAVVAIAILLGGWFINQSLKRLEAKNKVAEALLERRSSIFSDVSSDLNRIFCFSAYVGSWLNDSPKEIIEAKRRCDAKLFGEIAFWDSDVLEHYMRFSEVCFTTYQGRGTSAKLRADVSKYIEALGESWDYKNGEYFVQSAEREAWLSKQSILLGKTSSSFSQDLVVPSYSRLVTAIGRCMGSQIDEEKIATALKRPKNR